MTVYHVFVNSSGNGASVATPPDVTQLFDSNEKCLAVINRCERRTDRNLALTVVQAFEEKINNQENGTDGIPDCADAALRILLKIFIDHHDVDNTIRVVTLLEQLNVLDGNSLALVMQVRNKAVLL